eukprot:5982838-Amphidinium_carterae.1
MEIGPNTEPQDPQHHNAPAHGVILRLFVQHANSRVWVEILKKRRCSLFRVYSNMSTTIETK